MSKMLYNKSRNVRKSVPLLLSASIFALLLMGAGGLLPMSSVFGATPYNNVQVFVQTKNLTQGIFTIAAYNSSGFLVSSTQTQFPAGAFELPSGSYLFTVSAMDQSQYYPGPLPMTDVTGGVAKGVPTTGSSSAAISQPYPYQYPKVEYGFVKQDISGAVTINIATQPIENITLAKVSIKVTFVNGTAAAGAQVSASVVGAWYWWYGVDTKTNLYAQTGSDGVAQLTIPSVPVVVTAWDWVSIDLPKNQTTIPYNVGGETVNVTVYWQPSYVGLAGSALIIPPQTSATIVLHAQQPTYWYMAGQASSAVSAPTTSGASGTIADSNMGVPSFIGTQAPSSQGSSSTAGSLPTEIPSFTVTNPTSNTVATSASNNNDLVLTIAVVAAIAIAALSLGMVILRGRKSPA
jgi:hypothetical protein